MIHKIKALFGSGKAHPKHSVDLHSHLLPGIDDGVKSIDESISILKETENAGFVKVITTPHVYQDYYPNSPETIRTRLEEVKSAAVQAGLKITIEAAAEYFLDSWFMEQLEDDQELLTFGRNLLLIETSFNIQPLNLLDSIFLLQSKGYAPVLAHPERYTYLHDDWKRVEEMKKNGLCFQLNINSLGGFYGSGVKKMAQKLVDRQLIDFVGSDCHSMRHFEAMTTTMKSRYWKKVMALPLKNDEL